MPAMPNIDLNDLERWILISHLRDQNRNSTGKGNKNDVDRTDALLDAFGAVDLDRKLRHTSAHAKSALRKRLSAQAERDGAVGSPLYEPTDEDLAKASEFACRAIIDEFDPEADGIPVPLDKAEVEYLRDELARMDEKGQFRLAASRRWRRIREQVLSAVEELKKPAAT